MSMTLPIAILRTPEGFHELLTTRATEGAPFRLIQKPLDDKKGKKLWQAWSSLQRVSKIDGSTVANVLALMLSTVRTPKYDEKSQLSLALLNKVEPEIHKATARHPRAYKGTKFKPPKYATSRDPIDIRPCLFNEELFRDLSSRFIFHWSAAKEILIDEWSLDEERLEGLFEKSNFTCHPYLRYWTPNFSSNQRLHEHFAFWLLPLAKDRAGWANKLYNLFHRLDLSRHPLLLASVVYLERLSIEDNALFNWSEKLVHLPGKRRISFVEELVNSAVHTMDDVSLPNDVLSQLSDTIKNDEEFNKWLCWFLRSLKLGAQASYLLNGIKLFREFDRKELPHVTQGKEDVDFQIISDASYQFIVEEDIASNYFVLELWELGGLLPNFCHYIGKVIHSDFHRRCKYNLLTFFHYFLNEQRDKLMTAWHSFLAYGLDEFCSRARRIEKKYHYKAADIFYDVYEGATPKSNFTELTHRAIQLVDRFCKPPFHINNNGKQALSLLTEILSGLQWKRVLGFPDNVLISLERACSYANHQGLIARGLRAFINENSETFLDLWEQEPKSLIKLLLSLANLEYLKRRKAIRDGLSSSLSDIARADDETLLTMLGEVGNDDLWHGLASKRLKEHVAGHLTLETNSLRGHLERLRSKAKALTIRVIGKCAKELLSSEYPEANDVDEAEIHAMAFPRMVWENGRILRRFLRAHWRGDNRFIRQHPKTKAWLAKHPKLNLRRWMSNFTINAKHSKFGKISLTTEKNPLEVLRMGSYARSCLGLGGGFTDSAAAALLDINKHVVYGRAESGKVVGRQLIAITEKDELAVFHIYVNEEDKELKSIFAKFDYAFAQYLGTEVLTHCRKDCPTFLAGSDYCEECEVNEYEIATILSHDWYDDEIWEPRPPK